jgi:ATPase subunit of ABC transporter with duplicated ATPase domains
VSAGLEQRERERLEQERLYERARREHRRIEAEAARRREEAAVQNRKRSKRSLSWKDSDAREKIDRARISGSDGQAGRLLNQLDGRRAQTAGKLAATERPLQERVGISVHGVRARSDLLVRREAGVLELPDGRLVRHPELLVRPDDRVALLGPNGAGKSTLLAALLGKPPERADVLLPNAARGRVISTVSRLASDPESLLATDRPSPGETRKLMLARGLERAPALVVMDEPTNHLDLISMQCLEQALREFAGALLLVSHDERFIEELCETRWEISPEGQLEISVFR